MRGARDGSRAALGPFVDSVLAFYRRRLHARGVDAGKGGAVTAVQRSPTASPHWRSLPFSDGTFALDLDPLSLLCRLATAVPPPRFNTVRYAGVLAAASTWRARVVPPLPAAPSAASAAGAA